MRKIPSLIILLAAVYTASAQEATVFGIKAGVNSSVFSTSVNSTTSAKAGFNMGIFLKTPLSEKTFFRTEFYYSNQGENEDHKSSPTGPSVGTTTTTLHYLNLPLLLEFGRTVSFQIGPQVGFLLSGKQVGTISGKSVNDDLTFSTSKVDFGMVGGMGVSPSKGFSFGLRYNLGLTDIITSDDKTSNKYPTIANRVFHVYLAVEF